MSTMPFGHYAARDSSVHALDPRVKTIGTTVLSVLIFRATWLDACLISLFLISVAAFSRLGAAVILRAIRPIAFFAGLLFLLHLFFPGDTALAAQAGSPCEATCEGLSQGAFVAWQFAALVFAGTILAMTTSPSELICGLMKLLRPLERLGVPTQDVAVMVSMALRSLPILLSEFERIRDAQTARGVDIGAGSLLRRTKSAASMILPLLLSTLRRADELADAMEARGYGSGPRTSMRVLGMQRRDFAALFGLALFAALLSLPA